MPHSMLCKGDKGSGFANVHAHLNKVIGRTVKVEKGGVCVVPGASHVVAGHVHVDDIERAVRKQDFSCTGTFVEDCARFPLLQQTCCCAHVRLLAGTLG